MDYRLKDNTPVLIRNVSEDDAPQLLMLKKEVTEEKVYTLREPDELTADSKNEADDINLHLERDGYLYVVAEIDGRIAGFIQFENGSLRRTSHTGLIYMVVKPEYRGKGIGALLLGELIKWAEENPLIEKLCLAVFSSNTRAINLYKKMGFTQEGYCPKDMKLQDGTYIDSILMYKPV